MDSFFGGIVKMKSPFLRLVQAVCFVVAIPIFFIDAHAQVVPGTGMKLNQVGDDFEDVDWKWVPNGSKASRVDSKLAWW